MKNLKMKQKITISIDWDFPSEKRMGKKGKDLIFDYVADELRRELKTFNDARGIKVAYKLRKAPKAKNLTYGIQSYPYSADWKHSTTDYKVINKVTGKVKEHNLTKNQATRLANFLNKKGK